jgi:hypothetical protein
MAIKISCEKCRTSFSIRDEFGGKTVKCTKCSAPMLVPIPNSAASPDRVKSTVGATTAAKGTAGAKGSKIATGTGGLPLAPRFNPLLDLLDEAGVKGRSKGPVCESCGSEMSPTAVICVQCGFNMATGEKLGTAVLINDNDELVNAAGMTDAEKLLAKAEKDIDEMPVSSFGQDFGEGNESFLIALVAFISLAVFVGLGVTCVLLMDRITDFIKPEKISLLAAIFIALGCMTYITIIAFLSSPAHGIACVATAGLYCIAFAFMQGKSLIIPAIILVGSILIGFVSLYFVMYPSEELGMMIEPILWQALAFQRF